MPRVLIIDDDEQVRELIRAYLEEAGYQVDEAADGTMGLQQFYGQPADLIITDIFMPPKEGITIIMELKAVAPDLKIIAISGGGLTGDLEFLQHAKTFGADVAYEKPLDLEELIEAVTNLVGPGAEVDP